MSWQCCVSVQHSGPGLLLSVVPGTPGCLEPWSCFYFWSPPCLLIPLPHDPPPPPPRPSVTPPALPWFLLVPPEGAEVPLWSGLPDGFDGEGSADQVGRRSAAPGLLLSARCSMEPLLALQCGARLESPLRFQLTREGRSYLSCPLAGVQAGALAGVLSSRRAA